MSWILESLRAFIDDMDGVTSGATLEAEDSYKRRIELIYRQFLATEIVHGSGLSEAEIEALGYVAQAYDTMSNLVDNVLVQPVSRFCTSTFASGAVERPSFQIPFEQLRYLIDYRFSVPQIAQLLGVSIRTIRRRMSENNMSIRSTYSRL